MRNRNQRSGDYEALRDLNFEFRVGKLSDEDYQKTKAGLQKDLAGVLAEMDTVTGSEKPQKPKEQPKPDGRVCPHCGAISWSPTASRYPWPTRR